MLVARLSRMDRARLSSATRQSHDETFGTWGETRLAITTAQNVVSLWKATEIMPREPRPRPPDGDDVYDDEGGDRRRHDDYDERDYEGIYRHFDDVAQDVILANASKFMSPPEPGASYILLLVPSRPFPLPVARFFSSPPPPIPADASSFFIRRCQLMTQPSTTSGRR